jgi:uncharacterized protein (TIGR03437 family)
MRESHRRKRRLLTPRQLSRMKTAILKLCTSAAALIGCATFAGLASAQSFDTSGNGMLKGDYFVRQVLTLADVNTSAVTRAVSLIGVMTFDGNGNYSFTGQKNDSSAGSPGAFTTTGGYSVAANGMLQIQNPIDNTDTEYGALGAIGPNAVVASATEGQYDDILVAIPAGSGANNGSVQGSYQGAFIDFLNANASQVRDGYFTLTSNGSGSFGTVSVNGSMANQNNSNTTQSLSGVAYSITGANGSGTITFPTASSPTTALLSGQKTFYVSQDGNLLLGGAFNGFDILIGIKSASGVSNSTFNGTYFTAALENDASGSCGNANCIDSFYGSINSKGSGTTIAHLRLVGFDFAAYDYTTDNTYSLSSSGVYNDGTIQTMLGAGGAAFLQVGTGQTYSLTLGIRSKPFSGTGVFLNPVAILNAANFAPITNSVAPGEYVTLFGSGLAATTAQAQSVPFPTTLGGVQVTVNGSPAPLYFVSSGQINMLMPFSTPANSFATFKVINNGVSSNQVTLYTAGTAPGVFTTTQDGIGPAAVEHADGSLVTQGSPAKAGEPLSLFLTGLGTVTPSVADGAVPSTTSTVDDPNLFIDIFDQNGNDLTPNISFSGLSGCCVALYQINFTLPSGLASGLAYVDVGTTDGYTTEAKIFIK